MEISVIIVTYNCCNVIKNCLSSLVNYKNIETIVVDNHSTDSTSEIIKEYSNIRLVQNTVNEGFTKACNQGIKLAKSDYIFLLNPDCIVTEDIFIPLRNALIANPEICLVSPNLLYKEGTLQRYTRRFPSIQALFIESFIPKYFWLKFKSYRHFIYFENDFENDFFAEQPPGAAMMFHKKWLLDERFFIYGSDLELCLRMHNQGYKLLQKTDVSIVHLQSKGGTGERNQTLRMFLDLDNYYAMRILLNEYYSKGYARFYLIAFTVGLFLTFVVSLVIPGKSSSIKWKRFIYFLQNKNFRHYPCLK